METMDRSLKRKRMRPLPAPRDTGADWTKKCEQCGALPTVPLTGMCGPCTFGESDTVGGNW